MTSSDDTNNRSQQSPYQYGQLPTSQSMFNMYSCVQGEKETVAPSVVTSTVAS